ncbi:MAG: hypothetical protein KDK78_12485, partial [Chlamydiia bacterium]|nr:hypothetical protein [Chlamydiia bacterium]
MTQLTAFGWSAVSLYIVCNALIIGRGFLLPLAVAFAITYLLIALSNGLMTLHVGRWRAPRWLARIVVLLAFIMVSQF